MNKIDFINKTNILWLFFIIITGLHIVDIINKVLGGSSIYFFEILKIYLPIILLFFHSSWTLTYSRGFFLILLAALTSFVFEVIGINYGTFFGADYVYQGQNFSFILFNVPLFVPLYWAVFIYIGYSISNSFLNWIGKSRPTKDKNDFIILPLLIIFDGLLVTAIDIFMEPILVKFGVWTWLSKGQYFGVPFVNFIGWFTVAIITTGIFRVFEYFIPRSIYKISDSVMLIPVLYYGILCLSFLSDAATLKMYNLMLVGFFAMIPVVVINLILFFSRKNFKSEQII
ncbi:carotenoid biosynthesis protein [Candidatus Parcubacteria bacterium]|nr:carotenoid biosynthesis protein [Patescibacteria group bacterium]MBU4309591.1 carotenoid biosynthesis protein [Patescibacteria group bacterium]MBU4578021.1 carotenoid biosynthesis protein [Patescibacteria group bacterium]MCG2696471.1 carotenoid biosynthesis protein [Candidatus Parcubacteria bacterium]